MFGSLERFFGILVEHYNGAFPLWLAPEQARILPITSQQHEFARQVESELKAAGLRVTVDDRSQGLGAKIKDCRHDRLQYILVIGEREAAEGKVGVRSRREGELGAMPVSELAAKMRQEIIDKVY